MIGGESPEFPTFESEPELFANSRAEMDFTGGALSFALGEVDHPSGGWRPAVTADGRPRTGVCAPADEGVAAMRKPAAILFVLSIAVLALALVPAAGLAAKGGGSKGGGGGGGSKPGGGGSTGGTSSISLATPLVYDADGSGTPNYLDVVTFNVSTTATTEPFVNLQCYQDGVKVLEGWQGFFDGALNTTRNFGLYSGVWHGGATDCTAWLDMYTGRGWSQLASTSFHVDA
jgi:hypothetical protein